MASRDHGGSLDAAIARFGGERSQWVDLSTGINPLPYPLPALDEACWQALPDHGAGRALEDAAREFWDVPNHFDCLAAPGASALIARIPALLPAGSVRIDTPTYNEHAAAFTYHGWKVVDHTHNTPEARVLVHPNNPDGRWYNQTNLSAPLCVIDESFCDIVPERSLLPHCHKKQHIILKSFGKFWGLAGVRLGFAIGDPALLAGLRELLGPWPVSGPAMAVGTAALSDHDWASNTRVRLNEDAARLEALMLRAGARQSGGTSLFRLFHVHDAQRWFERFAEARVLIRTFPYSDSLIRLGIPHPDDWPQVESAI